MYTFGEGFINQEIETWGFWGWFDVCEHFGRPIEWRYTICCPRIDILFIFMQKIEKIQSFHILFRNHPN